MSKSIGSVDLCHTSYAVVLVNSAIQRGLKSSIELLSPPVQMSWVLGAMACDQYIPVPVMITLLPFPFARNSRYRTDASAAEMYSSNCKVHISYMNPTHKITNLGSKVIITAFEAVDHIRYRTRQV
jgi:hypothetical protein